VAPIRAAENIFVPPGLYLWNKICMVGGNVLKNSFGELVGELVYKSAGGQFNSRWLSVEAVAISTKSWFKIGMQ
ncbi:hypothetical protein J6590_070814, partial [Homalodisca vitripennis]